MSDATALVELGDEQLWEPLRVVPPGPWTGHISFAFWLIKALRPATLVELGTHSGNSYFAFCQAMAQFSPAGRAFAVDTWRGDDHAGTYGEDVFADVTAFNAAQFGRFSTLLRAQFDDARAYFPAGQIDLLHIDGMHTYEAVRHDFETWQEALSSCAVVVLHDTNVRERNFGVWRFWQELRERYPTFEFIHGNGLGIAGVGEALTPAMRALFALSGDEQRAGVFRRRIATRGETFQWQSETLSLREHLQQTHARAHDDIGGLQARLEQGERALADRDQALRERDQHLVERVAELGALQAELDAARQALAEQTARQQQSDAAGVLAAQSAQHDRAELDWQRALHAAQREVIAAKDAMIATVGNVAAARGAALAARDAIITARDALAARLLDGTAALTSEVQQARLLADQEVARAAQERALREVAEALHRQALAEQERAQAQQAAAVERARDEAAAAAARRYAGSTSWKLTRPLRVVGRLIKGEGLRGGRDARGVVHDAVVVAEAAPRLEAAVARPPAESVAEISPGKRDLRALFAARLAAFLSSSAVMRLPADDRPDISIIIVVYNQADLTLACLSSIVETLADRTFGVEVVIADNASSDDTAALLGRIEGATILRNAINLHFLRAVNAAARQARGRAILLLNNDAQVMPGAVASALRVLDGDAGIGAVGGRIILPDGTLQEAGSIIWRDGACSGYARGDDPAGADAMFQRDVDYCSGAFLLTPARLWRDLHGFDERYAPAYYEETDYCVRVWKAGYRVVYDPDAAIIHYEFGSAAGKADALRLQAANHAVFQAQHAQWLEGQFPANPTNVLLARHARSDRPHVLVLEDRVPNPALGSGYPRANQLLHELVRAGATVTLFPMFRFEETWSSVRHVLDPRIEVLFRAEAAQLRSYLIARPRCFDAVLVCRPHNMRALLEAIGPQRELLGGARLLYDAEAIFATRDLQRQAEDGQPASAEERHRIVADEVTLTRLAETVISVSPIEQQTLEDYGARAVRLLGHALDDRPIATGFAARDEIVFLGALGDENAPNADAVRWFSANILPALRTLLGRPGLLLTLIGRVGAASVRALDGVAVDMRGMVDDLPAALARARIMVVPTRLGAGIPHKVHQAAMLGIPVVTTTLIADQLGWHDSVELLVADEPGGFARACARLFEDEAVWHAVRAAALARARVDCAPDVFARTVRAIVADLPLVRRRPEGVSAAVVARAQPTGEPLAARPAAEDWSVAVPFGFAPLATPPPRIGVVCHLFHVAVAPEVLFYLRHLPGRADVFMSTDTDDKRAALLEVFGAWDRGAVEIRVVPNCGRDIAPKLIGFADVHESVDLVLHLHSKLSTHAAFLQPWRSYLFETLLGSPEIVRSSLDAFARLSGLGMLAPQHFEPVRRWLGWNGNFERARGLADRMGIALSSRRALDFPSGSMFWARPAALRPLLDLGLVWGDFGAEDGALDHTLAHAIERLFFYSCERSGHFWLKTACPALMTQTATVAEVNSPAALSAFAAEHGVALSGPGTIEVAECEAPMMTRVAPGLVRRLAGRAL